MDPDEFEEARALLAWVADHHFTFLGYREYELDRGRAARRSRAPGSGCCAAAARSPRASRSCRRPCARWRRSPTRSCWPRRRTRSPVHRPAYLDYIGVKRFDADGNVVGERRFLGLYTTRAYRAAPANIPCCAARSTAVRRARRVPARQPRRQGADRGHRHVPARRALPDRRRRPVRGRVGHPRAGRAPARAAVHAHGPLRALRLLPRLHPARPLQHRQPGQDRRDPDRGARRRVGRLGRCG